MFWVLVTLFLCFGESIELNSTTFQDASSAQIFSIFQFLDWDDFYHAMAYFEITQKQKHYFPRYSRREYGSIASEYYLDENGSEILPPSVKQMITIQIVSENPLGLVLYHDGHVEHKFSGDVSHNELSAEKKHVCFDHVDSFFIDYHSALVLQKVVHTREKIILLSNDCVITFRDTPYGKEAQRFGTLWQEVVLKDFETKLFLFTPSIGVHGTKSSKRLQIRMHKFTQEDQTFSILCSLADPKDNLFAAKMKNSGEVESIVFMEKKMKIDEFIEFIELCSKGENGIIKQFP